MTLLGVGSTYYFNFEEKRETDKELTSAGMVDADAMWERISYFLERVIPVAEEYKVKMACHPHDPGMPSSGYRGIDRVLGTVEGAKKFADLVDSPYHGFNFCQGTFAEMLENPGKEIFDVIRYFGERKKILWSTSGTSEANGSNSRKPTSTKGMSTCGRQ